MKLTNKVSYSAKHDRLVVEVDCGPSDVDAYFEYQSDDGVLTMTFNKYTGGLMEFELAGLKSTFEDDAPSYLSYDDQSDSLRIALTDDDSTDGLCDMIYNDADKHTMITANRNRVGNLTGLEIVGVETLIGNLICEKN